MPACKGKGYSKKESQQVAAHETLNMIKKNSAFVESIFAAKTKREEVKEESFTDTESVDVEVPVLEMEVSSHSDDLEEIIRKAEDAAYSEIEA